MCREKQPGATERRQNCSQIWVDVWGLQVAFCFRHIPSPLSVPTSWDGCEDSGVRFVFVENYEVPSVNGSDSFSVRGGGDWISENTRYANKLNVSTLCNAIGDFSESMLKNVRGENLYQPG